MASPARSFAPGFAAAPLSVTCPALDRDPASRERESAGTCAARKWSSRAPAPASGRCENRESSASAIWRGACPAKRCRQICALRKIRPRIGLGCAKVSAASRDLMLAINPPLFTRWTRRPEAEDPLLQICPDCGAGIDVSDEEPLSAVICPVCGAPSVVAATDRPFRAGGRARARRHGRGLSRSGYFARPARRAEAAAQERVATRTSQIAQLETEAAITASINHPHVVKVFTTGTDHGRFYIAMELVDKGTLDDLIELQGRVAEAQVLEVGIQIAQGLRAAQQAGPDSSRREAGQHPFCRCAHRQDRGLRPRHFRGGRGQGARRNLGHALLRRAGEAGQQARGFPQRHLLARRHAFSRARRPAAVRGGGRLDGRAQASEEPGGEPAGLCPAGLGRDGLSSSIAR